MGEKKHLDLGMIEGAITAARHSLASVEGLHVLDARDQLTAASDWIKALQRERDTDVPRLIEWRDHIVCRPSQRTTAADHLVARAKAFHSSLGLTPVTPEPLVRVHVYNDEGTECIVTLEWPAYTT